MGQSHRVPTLEQVIELITSYNRLCSTNLANFREEK
jgi:hypothetical protein